MKKRALAGAIWFYAGWYAWAMVASVAALPQALGPVVGAGIGGFFALDPLGRIWKRPGQSTTLEVTSVESQGAVRS
jgi:hypothetical protein